MLVLETERSARARGVRILARLSGWGASCDAWHATAPQPQGEGALAAMRRALHSSRLLPCEIGYVSAHGTGTPDNDAMESAALKTLFEQAVPPVASLKGFFGHTLAASGALQAVVSVRALLEQGCPGNPGFEQSDPRLGLEPLKTFQPQKIAHILSNSFGFGGNNVALVFSCPEPSISTTSFSVNNVALPNQRVAVVGAGIVSARAKNFAELASAYSQDAVAPTLYRLPDGWPVQEIPALSCQPFEENSGVDPAKRRKLSRLQLMMLAAVRQALTPELLNAHARDRVCVALGTGLGALNDTAAFLENLWLKEERAPRPLFFTNSVHNSLASQVAIEWKLAGLNATVTHRETSFDAALWQGAREITAGHADLAIVGGADELNPYYLAVGQRWGRWDSSRKDLPGEASAAFTLADAGKTGRPLGFVSAIRTGRWMGQNSDTFDAAVEAEWMAATLAREGISLESVDLLLTGGNQGPLDSMIQVVANTLSGRAGRIIPLGFYEQACGRLPTASAFGFATALALVRGQIPLQAVTALRTTADAVCRRV
ncbi:MAG TPA: beta-ketoacyl synthase N-terminal-like domain-containing protein, partial [Bacillota bacterium]|nr:beta-ketoacyl synthase N-terminal-like domain-containing protein [Bacillota bacterium]